MKKSLVFVVLLFSFIGFAQENEAASAPLILKKLFYQQSVSFGDYSVKFSELISDSRCPIGVTCIWAGEVVFTVTVSKNDTIVSSETFKIPPTSYTDQERKLLTLENGLTLCLYNVMPFPKAEKKIATKDYYLQYSDAN